MRHLGHLRHCGRSGNTTVSICFFKRYTPFMIFARRRLCAVFLFAGQKFPQDFFSRHTGRIRRCYAAIFCMMLISFRSAYGSSFINTKPIPKSVPHLYPSTGALGTPILLLIKLLSYLPTKICKCGGTALGILELLFAVVLIWGTTEELSFQMRSTARCLRFLLTSTGKNRRFYNQSRKKF